MNCPKCLKPNSKVLDSRATNCLIKRRRECIYCDYRFTTFEEPAPLNIKVIKRNDTIEKFDRNKILNSIKKACNKLPIKDEEITKITFEIEHLLYKKYDNEILSKNIGKHILNKLLLINKVAYLRFASVYKNFKNVDKFSQEINKIKSK